MANETVITVCGVLGQDPELRFTPAGKPVANLSIASTPSRYDRQTSQWTDGTTMWMRASAWGDMAENIAESLRKGMRVIAQGRLGQRDYTTREGENHSTLQLEIVNPARAGMIRLAICPSDRRTCKPRASGDDPGTTRGFSWTNQ